MPGTRVIRWAACLLAATAAVPSQADVPSSQTRQVRFDLPPMPLGHALDRFAAQASLQILYPPDATRGRRSVRVSGARQPRDALARLIAGTPLRIARWDGNSVTLRLAPPRPASRRRGPPPVPAFSAPSPPPVAAADPPIIVTGRAAFTPMGSLDTSYAITIIDDAERARRAPQSVAELLRLVPGFWVEATGGEVANNVRARGIPTDGYSSVALLEDGLPVQYDGALGYLNTDQSFRADDMVKGIEAVRGGPSALFAPNAPGGTINFILRNGLDDPGASVRASLADYGYRRIDGFWGARFASGWGISAGGFARISDGIRPPGFPADRGGQVRLRVDYAAGENRFSLTLRHLDDHVAFYLPVPLARLPNGSIGAVPGFDPLRNTLAGPDNNGVTIRTPAGDRSFDLDTGTHSRLTGISGSAHVALAPAMAIEERFALRFGDTQRNALFPTGRPIPASEWIEAARPGLAAAVPDLRDLAFRYAGTGEAVRDPLVIGANLMSVHLPMDEIVSDTRLIGRLALAGTHDLVAGLTYADYRFGFDRFTGSALIEAAARARRLDVTALGRSGQPIIGVTDRGILRHSSIADSAILSARSLAFYATDEWQFAPALRFDYGARFEQIRINGHAAAKALFDFGDPATLADNQAVGFSGPAIPVERQYRGFGWSAGLHFRTSRRLALFARTTDSFRLPSAGEFAGDPARTDLAPVPIRMIEAGLYLRHSSFDGSLVGFYTRFKRLPFIDFRFDTARNEYVQRTQIADTEALGIEGEVSWRPRRWFTLGGQVTVQDPRYRRFQFAELVEGAVVDRDYSGNQLIRVPRLALRATPEVTLLNGAAAVRLDVTHYSQRYSDIANRQALPSYTLIGLSASISSRNGSALTAELSNLFNTLGLTEGNPRLGAFESNPTPYFLARPEFGRTFRLSWLRRFGPL